LSQPPLWRLASAGWCAPAPGRPSVGVPEAGGAAGETRGTLTFKVHARREDYLAYAHKGAAPDPAREASSRVLLPNIPGVTHRADDSTALCKSWQSKVRGSGSCWCCFSSCRTPAIEACSHLLYRGSAAPDEGNGEHGTLGISSFGMQHIRGSCNTHTPTGVGGTPRDLAHRQQPKTWCQRRHDEGQGLTAQGSCMNLDTSTPCHLPLVLSPAGGIFLPSLSASTRPHPVYKHLHPPRPSATLIPVSQKIAQLAHLRAYIRFTHAHGNDVQTVQA
jgi:hypothetical protein